MKSKSFISDKECKKCKGFERYKSSKRCVACALNYQKKKYGSDVKENVRLEARLKCMEALSQGLVTYESITPCKNCGSNIRYVSSNACQCCAKKKSKEYKAAKELNAIAELRELQEQNTINMLLKGLSGGFIQNAENFKAKLILEPSDFEHDSEYYDYRNSDSYTRGLKLIAIQEQLKQSPKNELLKDKEYVLKFMLGKADYNESALDKFNDALANLTKNNEPV